MIVERRLYLFQFYPVTPYFYLVIYATSVQYASIFSIQSEVSRSVHSFSESTKRVRHEAPSAQTPLFSNPPARPPSLLFLSPQSFLSLPAASLFQVTASVFLLWAVLSAHMFAHPLVRSSSR